MTTVALGLAVPPYTPHAVSVSLPTWRDNIGYEEGEKRVVDSMVSGYPRFFIHLSIKKLAQICEDKYDMGNEKCMLFPTHTIAAECKDFITRRAHGLTHPPRLVHLFLYPESCGDSQRSTAPLSVNDTVDLHIVLFPSHVFSIAKEFWQHTGLGISSRFAEKCLSLLPGDTPPSSPRPSPPRFLVKAGHNRHYSVGGSPPGLRAISPSAMQSHLEAQAAECLSSDQAVYVEERYGRNLPIAAAATVKRALCRRVAGTLIKDGVSNVEEDNNGVPAAGEEGTRTGPSSRGVTAVTENDVYLFPCGMAAVWGAHKLAREVRPEGKSVCFGFPYTDTLKVLQKWGPGAHFFGSGLDRDIDALEALLQSKHKTDPFKPPILALFTEFPSNPLLRSANLPRIRALADKYNFLVVVDETIGNFVNVDVLPYADIVVSSLTKVFSGASNVMGGSLVLNPQSRYYAALKSHLVQTYEDTYFDEDVIFMERNSRDFRRRIKIIDANTEAICDFLRSRSVIGNPKASPRTAIKSVFYPKYITPENYNRCRIKTQGAGGYGGLFSLTFTSPAASKAFFDALPCCKGPSLGTNFTLACPYTILAHYTELDWAGQFGVEKGLVRVSVGMEGREELLRTFVVAVKAAESVAAAEIGNV